MRTRRGGHRVRRRRRARSARSASAAATIIWGAGVAASPAAKWLGAERDRAGRVKVGAGPNGARAIPRSSSSATPPMPLGADGKPLPGVAPVAKQQGNYVATLIARAAGRADRSDAVPLPRPRQSRDDRPARRRRRFRLAQARAARLAWLLWGAGPHLFLIGFRNRLVGDAGLAGPTSPSSGRAPDHRAARFDVRGFSPNPTAPRFFKNLKTIAPCLFAITCCFAGFRPCLSDPHDHVRRCPPSIAGLLACRPPRRTSCSALVDTLYLAGMFFGASPDRFGRKAGAAAHAWAA